MSSSPGRAIVFDLDGVLVDSEPAHLRASQRLVAPQRISEEDYARFTGLAIEPFMEWVREHYALADPVEALRLRYAALTTTELRSGAIEPLDGARELIAAARAAGWAVGLASQSIGEWVDATLDGCGLADAFDVAISGDDIERAKPAPDIFLLAAKRLGVAPAACVAIEDSPAGVKSAETAGMFVVQSRQASTAAPPQPGARRVVASLRELDLATLGAQLPRAGL